MSQHSFPVTANTTQQPPVASSPAETTAYSQAAQPSAPAFAIAPQAAHSHQPPPPPPPPQPPHSHPVLPDRPTPTATHVTASGNPSFRRQRASRACVTCHARKVRCDAASLGVPCTNCTAFSIECQIPAPKRKRPAKSKDENGLQSASDSPHKQSGSESARSPIEGMLNHDEGHMNGCSASSETSTGDINSREKTPVVPTSQLKSNFARAPIKEAGRVAYLGESSNLTLLVNDRNGTSDVVHYPLPEYVRGAKARVSELDHLEIDILKRRGAFLLPPRPLCDELVDSFFTWVAPVVPVINRNRFMRQYHDPKNPPSLLLLQAVFLAGSRVCTNPQLRDSSGSTTPAAMTFYKRAKALYDANYEDDRVTIVQALILMGWYWEGPEDVTKNVYYWTRVAIVVAQGSGMHRSVEKTQLRASDKRLWKRIWWTLYSRDRSCAVALGRPVSINPKDSDVDIITTDDFNEEEDGFEIEYQTDPVHVNFFISYVKLCEIMGLVLAQQYSVGSKGKRGSSVDLEHGDIALGDWRRNCPHNVVWDKPRHHYWAALLFANYFTTLCLLHRAYMPPAGSPKPGGGDGAGDDTSDYPSSNIATEAANTITEIVQTLEEHDEMRYTPAFVIYSLFSALIVHIYHMRTSDRSLFESTGRRIQICMDGLKSASKVWLVSKMVHSLFESILGNKSLEEKLQRMSGKRHKKSVKVGPSSRGASVPSSGANHAGPSTPTMMPPVSTSGLRLKDSTVPNKRKFEDLDLGFSNPHPTPPVSYERSRPQSPSREYAYKSKRQHQSEIFGQPQAENGMNGSSYEFQQTPPYGQQQQQHQQQQQQQHNGISMNLGASAQVVGPAGGGSFNGHNQVTPEAAKQAMMPPYLNAASPELFLYTRNSPVVMNETWKSSDPYDMLFPGKLKPTSNGLGEMSADIGRDPGMDGGADGGSIGSDLLQQAAATDVSAIRAGADEIAAVSSSQEFANLVGSGWPEGGSGYMKSDDTSSSGNQLLFPANLNIGDWMTYFGMNSGEADPMMGPFTTTTC